MKLTWFLARRYLSSTRGGGRLLSFITWIALGGVTVGVTALTVVIGVMTGMQEDLRDKILAANPHVLILQSGSALRMTGWRAVLDSARSVDGVEGATPFTMANVALERGGYSQPALLLGIPTDSSMATTTAMEEKIREGIHDLDRPPSGLPPLLPGSDMALRMQLFPGDTVHVLSAENLRLGTFGMSPTVRSFEVTGTFTTGMYEYDNGWAYTTLEAGRELLGMEGEDAVSGIGIRTVDPDRADEIAEGIRDRLASPFTYTVQSWTTRNRALFSALKLEKLAMGLILFLIVVVAAFNIVSTLVMVVSDRVREIGILKSMGMTDRNILRVFVLQGAWIGMTGTALGTALGLGLCWAIDTYDIIPIPPEVYFVDHLPVSLHVLDIAAIVGGSVLLSFVATIYPSVQASRLQPVEAIRHE